MIKFLEVKRAYYADPDNVVVESTGPTHNWAATDPEENGWRNDWQWRIRPRTIRIGDIDVPEPVREKLEVGDYYYIVDCTAKELQPTKWCDLHYDHLMLSNGLIHLNIESANIHKNALIIVSGGKV